MRLSGKLQFDAFNTGFTTKNTKITKGKCTFFFILSGPSWLCMPHLGFLHNHKIKILPRRPQRTQRMLFKELLSRPFLNFVSFVVIKTKPLRHERILKPPNLKRPKPPRQPSPITVPRPAAVWLCAFLFRHPTAK